LDEGNPPGTPGEFAIREKAVGPNHPDVALALHNLAWVYEAQGRYADAEPLLRRSLAIMEKAVGRDHPTVAIQVNSLASLYLTQGRYSEAEPLYERALAIREKTLGPEHPEQCSRSKPKASRPTMTAAQSIAPRGPFLRQALARSPIPEERSRLA
jgi:tetratricopeptide (TPR) repeat protein